MIAKSKYLAPLSWLQKSKEDEQQTGERKQTDMKVDVLLHLHEQKIRDPINEVGEYVLYAKIVSAKTLKVRMLKRQNRSFTTSLCEVSIESKNIQRGWQGPYVEVTVSGLTVYDYLRLLIELVEKHGFEIEPKVMLEEVRKWSQFQLSE